jgi:hypothetical protein
MSVEYAIYIANILRPPGENLEHDQVFGGHQREPRAERLMDHCS